MKKGLLNIGLVTLTLLYSPFTMPEETQVQRFDERTIPEVRIRDLMQKQLKEHIEFFFGRGYEHNPEIVGKADADDFGKTLESKLPVVIEFSTEYCGPCKIMKPRFEELCKDYKGKAVCYEHDATKVMKIARKYKVSTFPTFLVFHKGNLVKRFLFKKPITEEEFKKEIGSFIDTLGSDSKKSN